MSFQSRSFAYPVLPVLLMLGGCGPKVECDSSETREAVLNSVSHDHANRLANYAAEKSDVAKLAEKAPESEAAKPMYLLGEKIVTTSTSADKKTLTCSGAISASTRFCFSAHPGSIKAG